MRVEFLNLNDDPKLDPEIKEVPLSKDGKNKPPAYCLPWVEATRYSIQLKSNETYRIKKDKNKIEVWIEHGTRKMPLHDTYLAIPKGVEFIPKNREELKEEKIHVSQTPSFSSPWQRKTRHSVTLKLGICWWTPPGWGLFVTSAVHRNEGFRVVEGFVRTDQWNRDFPIIIQPLTPDVQIKKYSVIASVLVIPAEDIKLISVPEDKSKVQAIAKQISLKRLNRSIYKRIVLRNGGKKK